MKCDINKHLASPVQQILNVHLLSHTKCFFGEINTTVMKKETRYLHYLNETSPTMTAVFQDNERDRRQVNPSTNQIRWHVSAACVSLERELTAGMGRRREIPSGGLLTSQGPTNRCSLPTYLPHSSSTILHTIPCPPTPPKLALE